jgi:hypothetical protein
MNTTLEEELSATLSARAATVPTGAAERLRAVEYHPRRRGRAAPVALGAAAAGAATAGTALAVVLGGAAPAYAGWSATPTAATTAAPSPQAEQSCLTSLPSNEPAGGQLGSGSWQSVLTDVRGPFTVALFQNSGAYAACFTSASFTEVTQVSADDSAATNAQSVSGTVRIPRSSAPPSDMSTVLVGGTSSGDLQNVVQTELSTTADGPYTLVDGRVASGVSAVTLVLDDGQDVVATVSDGWLIAWWPGDAAATSAQVTTASGTRTETLQSAAKTPPEPPPAGFNPAACAAAAGAANASQSPDGQPTNVPVHCMSSGNSGISAPGASTNSGGTGASLKSGG